MVIDDVRRQDQSAQHARNRDTLIHAKIEASSTHGPPRRKNTPRETFRRG